MYKPSYDSASLRGCDNPLTPRPWDITNLLCKNGYQSRTLLDLGTGTGFKILPLQKYFKKIYCLEVSKSMADVAKKNLPFENIEVIQGSNFELPFEDNTFDMIISILAPSDFKEIHRVLKKDGSILLEKVGCEDKKDFKTFFGADKEGIRGQFMQYSLEDYINYYYEECHKYFYSVSIKNGYWDTFYTAKGLLKLLANTPTIRGYKYPDDKKAFKTAIKTFSTPKGIMLNQNRVLVCAENPK